MMGRRVTARQIAGALAALAAAIAPWALAATGQTEEPAKQEVARAPVPPPLPVAAVQIDDPTELLARFPPFTTTERTPILEENGYFPCSDCHDNVGLKKDPTVRQLTKEHRDIVLVHGGGRYWCLTCHGDEDRDHLTSLKGKPISFDRQFLLCGQCHFDRQKDYFLGGHGKRIGSWQGEKKLAVCTDCHDAHDPAIKARQPVPPPKLRDGLGQPGRGSRGHAPVWARHQEESHE